MTNNKTKIESEEVNGGRRRNAKMETYSVQHPRLLVGRSLTGMIDLFARSTTNALENRSNDSRFVGGGSVVRL